MSKLFILMFLIFSQSVFSAERFFDVVQDATSPRETAVIIFLGGAGQFDKHNQGAGSVLLKMMDEGPQSLKSEEYRKKLFLMNAEIDFSQGSKASYVSVTAPAAQMGEAMKLAREVLLNPKLDNKTFKEAHLNVLTNTKAAFENMQSAMFFFAFRDVTKYHPDSMDGAAALQTIEKVDLEKVKNAHKKMFQFSKTNLAAIGPMKSEELTQLFNTVFAKELSAFPFEPQVSKEMTVDELKTDKMQVTILNKAGATDNQIVFIYPEFVERVNKERAVASLANRMMGGGLVGRLGDTLRTKRGLTYHAGSTFDSYKPYWYVWTFGGLEQFSGLITGVPEVIEKYKKEKIKSSELEQSKETGRTLFRDSMELPSDRLMARVRLKLLNLDVTYLDRYESLLASVTLKDVEQFRQKKLNIKTGYLYLMGDQEKLLPKLQQLGIPAKDVRIVEMSDLY